MPAQIGLVACSRDSLFAVGAQPERPKRTPPSRKWVWASLTADKDSFIIDVKAEMTRRDPDHRRTWVIVTDGERALQQRVCQTFENVTLCRCPSNNAGR